MLSDFAIIGGKGFIQNCNSGIGASQQILAAEPVLKPATPADGQHRFGGSRRSPEIKMSKVHRG
jgi:hypothetical protein